MCCGQALLVESLLPWRTNKDAGPARAWPRSSGDCRGSEALASRCPARCAIAGLSGVCVVGLSLPLLSQLAGWMGVARGE